jgi:hypothetical protein
MPITDKLSSFPSKLFWFGLALVCTALFLSSCSGQADMKRMERAIFLQEDQKDSSEFERRMLYFIAKAQTNDVDAMIAVTSKVTITKAGGEAALREDYQKVTIPTLKMVHSMLPGGESVFGLDESRKFWGWLFKRSFLLTNGKTANFQFAITREDEAVVVASFAFLGKPN